MEGNQQKMREALVLSSRIIGENGIRSNVFLDDIEEAHRAITAALAKPPRECDVGYVEDQIQRYSEFCRNHKKLKAPPIHSLEWAQRPYKGGAHG